MELPNYSIQKFSIPFSFSCCSCLKLSDEMIVGIYKAEEDNYKFEFVSSGNYSTYRLKNSYIMPFTCGNCTTLFHVCEDCEKNFSILTQADAYVSHDQELHRQIELV